MSHVKRFIIAAVIVISGLAMAPNIALPVQSFSWQRYASVYEPSSTTLFLPIVLR